MTNFIVFTDFENLCEQVKMADMPFRKHRLIVGYKGYFHASETGKLISLIDDCTTKALCLNHIVRRMPACTCSEAVAVIKAFKMIRDRVDALQTISKRICDPNNYEDLKPAFPFKSEMETARQMMTRIAKHFVQPMYGSLQNTTRPQSARSVYYKPKFSFLKKASRKTNFKSTPDLHGNDLELREMSESPSPRAENGLVVNEQRPASEFPIIDEEEDLINSSFTIQGVEPHGTISTHPFAAFDDGGIQDGTNPFAAFGDGSNHPFAAFGDGNIQDCSNHPFPAFGDGSSQDGSITSVDNKTPEEASKQSLLKQTLNPFS